MESMCHGDNCWLGLSYNDENLPEDGSVDKKQIQKFLKRLRKNNDIRFRYFCIGEYGDDNWRPHYHLCLFGVNKYMINFVPRMNVPGGQMGYLKEWTNKKGEVLGNVYVGPITEQSAQYSAGYTVSKLTKRKDFEKNGLEPEFMLSSRGTKDAPGGIGYPLVEKIAKKWKISGWHDKRIIRQLQIGGKYRPIGRYLTLKLAELVDIPEGMFETEYWLKQEENFENNWHHDSLHYIENITDEERMERVKMLKMFKMRGR